MKVPSLKDALQSAVRTAIEQPAQVPERPPEWLSHAEAAIENDDAEKIRSCCDLIASYHSQYRAEFDVRGWLFDLRNAIRVADGRIDLVLA